LFGCKPVERIFSHALVRFLLNARQNGKIVLHINDPPPHFGAVLKHFSNCPVILSYLGEINVPITQLFSRTKNLPSKINNFLDHLSFLKYINKINVITYSNNKNLDYLRRFYQGRMERLTMGCDFSFWKVGDRSAARHRLNLNGRTTVFFSSTNLISTKQIDKSIAAFIGLNHRYDYIYIVSGHGTGVYEDYLKSLSRPLAAQGRIKFVGYVSDDDLLDYYNAADYFILPSQNEGASVSIIKALACGIPVISTAVGGTAELMAEHNAGYLLDQDHRSWPGILEDILSGHKKITSLDREVVRKNYDWAEVTEKFIRIYRRLTSEYYDRKNSVAVLPQPERT
jgi:glycosyltransferase involved in cell wall biosynthesis